MIDIRQLREEPDAFIQAAQDKHIQADVERLLQVDAELKEVKSRLQDIATEKNRIGKSVPRLSGDDKAAALAKLAEFKQQEESLQNKARDLCPSLRTPAFLSVRTTPKTWNSGGKEKSASSISSPKITSNWACRWV